MERTVDELGNPNPKQRRGTVVLVVSCLVVAALSMAAFTGYFWLKGFQSSETAQPLERVEGLPVTVLVLGIDSGVDGNGHPIKDPRNGRTRSDTMIVASVDPQQKRIGLLSVPRDTRVAIQGRSGFEKIAHANAYGGPALAIKTVEQLLGVDINFYVRVDFQGFKAIVDALGGVEMTIPHQMDYEDPYQNLYIHIKPGKQLLNGEKALQVVRYRQYPNGDIDRIAMQQKFLQALAARALQMDTLSKLPQLQRELVKYVDTNMGPSDMLWFLNIARQAGDYSIEMATLPGEPATLSDANGTSISYWVVNQSSARKVVDKVLRGINHDANIKYRVAVVDSLGRAELVSKISQTLRDQGYTVVAAPSEDQPKSPQEQTVLVQHCSSDEPLRAVERSMRYLCADLRTKRRVDSSLNVDVTVVLGKDFAGQSSGPGGR
ncbi:MAG: LCP family protein [Bacillota bacterium]